MMHASLFLSTLALLPRALASSDLAFCATENTGNSDVVVNTYQSNGACEDTCSNYGLGILQYKKCWCSNIAPANSTTVDTSECDSSCPGYPKDSCGSAAKGVYAYVMINSKSITSTATGAVSQTDSGTTSTANVALTTSANGDVKTITVAASESTSSVDTSQATDNSKKSSGLSGGSIAGVVIGVIGGLALIGALIFLVFFYRKRARSASPVPSQDMTDRNSSASNWSRGVFPGGSGGVGRQNTFNDNRINQSAIYPNGARDSSVSLQDNEDYSRPVLRVTNAD